MRAFTVEISEEHTCSLEFWLFAIMDASLEVTVSVAEVLPDSSFSNILYAVIDIKVS